MFGSNTLSLPAPFAHEHRPLRLMSEAPRLQPTGQCHYQLLHPSAQHQICACQIYQHNRSAPGNICDCGHSSCYHGAVASEKSQEHAASHLSGLVDRVQKLEELILAERHDRDYIIAQERQIRERDIRVFRETLASFYQSEEEMQRKLMELKNKLDESTHERSRTFEGLGISTNTQTAGGKQGDRRVTEDKRDSSPRPVASTPRHASINTTDDVPGLTSCDERSSSSSSFSRHQTPCDVNAPIIEADSPRSSGILDLVNFPRPAVPPYIVPRRISPPTSTEEPRSSGFLGVDLRERFKTRMIRKPSSSSHTSAMSQVAGLPRHPSHDSPAPSLTMSPPTSFRQSTPRSLSRPSPAINGYSSSDYNYDDVSSSEKKKRKLHSIDRMALDVLADVSAASPLVS